MNGWWGIGSQIVAIGINVATALAIWKQRGDGGFALAFFAYAIACAGYAWSIYKGLPHAG